MRKFVTFVATSGSPTIIVENKELRSFLSELNPRFPVPSRNTVDREMSKLLTGLKKRISDSLQGGKIALTIDTWSRKGMSETFLGVTSHCVLKKSLVLFHATLAVKRFPHSHTAKRVLQLTRDVLKDWEIDVTRFIRILTDNGSNMVAAFRENSQIIAEEESEKEVEEEEEVEVEEVIVIEEAEVGIEDELDGKDEEMECDSSDILKEIEIFQYSRESSRFSVCQSEHIKLFLAHIETSCSSIRCMYLCKKGIGKGVLSCQVV